MVKKTYDVFSTKVPVSQTQPLPERQDQVKNNAGGYVFKVGDWKQLTRFLVLGTEGNTYYVSERNMTLDNAKVVQRCLAEDFKRAVDEIVKISSAGRAPKNDPALFALALAYVNAKGDKTKLDYLNSHLASVARIGTHLFHFVKYLDGMRGWGRGVRTGVANWYLSKNIKTLALQLGKYQSRDGWSHKDVIRLSHLKVENVDDVDTKNNLIKWAIGKEFDISILFGVPKGIELLKSVDCIDDVIRIVTSLDLPHEAIPTEYKTNPNLWEALLPSMGTEALIRNLGNMSKYGVFLNKENTEFVCKRLSDSAEIKSSMLHPIKILTALLTYEQGHGTRGGNSWDVNKEIVNALDKAFYLAFGNVPATRKKLYLGIDISGSMGGGVVAGVEGLTPRKAAAALAMVTIGTETNPVIKGFTSSGSYSYNWNSRNRESPKDGLTLLKLDRTMKLSEVEDYMSNLPMGGTDCSLPVLDAIKNKLDIDAFVIYTDAETWAGDEHVCKVLERYRKLMNKPDCKLIVVAMTSTGFTIADPNDENCLDIVGFDTATPEMIARFTMNEF